MLNSNRAFELLGKPLREQLDKSYVSKPSKIQELAIPIILKGENVLLIAPTGSGKTLAVIMPIFELFLSYRKKSPSPGISILYVTPLRSLNRDLLRRIFDIGKKLEIDVQVRHGDTIQSVRTKQAKKPPDMLITTPETLQAILPGKIMSQHLRDVNWVIVDEIHELVDSKRGVQLSIGLERLKNLVKKEFQRIGLSATIGDEDRIAGFLSGSGKSVKVLKSQEFKDMEIDLEYPLADKESYILAKSLGLPTTSIARIKKIAEIISNHNSTLLFTNTREHAEALGSQIGAIKKDLSIKVHHGSLSREIREGVEEEFQAGKLKGIICTSSLELGIDVGSVDYVIQYMSPRGATRLIQRIGRSNHRVEGMPKGCIITSFPDDYLESLVLINRAKIGLIETVKIHEVALDVLAHQIVGIILGLKRAKIEEIYSIINGAYPFRNLTADKLMQVVDQLENENILKVRDEWILPSIKRAYQYYYENLSVIPDIKKYNVLDFFRKVRIGTLDQEFVAKKCSSGVEFIMHGNTWRILSVDDESYKIEVEPAAPSFSAIPSWEGELIPVEYDVATEVGKLRRNLGELKGDENSIPQSWGEYTFNRKGAKRILKTIRKHIEDFPLPSDNLILIERFENCIIIHSCFGNLVNAVYGIILRTLLGARYGISTSVLVDPYRIALVCSMKISEKLVAKELLKLNPEDLEEIVTKTIIDNETFLWINWHVARRFGVIERQVDYKISRARQLAKILRDTPINQEAIRELFLEKLDIENAKKVVGEINKGKIKIEIAKKREENYSPLALPILDRIVPHNILRPIVKDKSLLEIIRERILSTTVRLVCIYNADWEGIRVVKNLSNSINCPKCGSTLISVAYRGDSDLYKIIKKKKKLKKLTKEESKIWNRAWKSASLVQNYGKKAIIVLASRGVGPTVASRILRKFIRNDSEFFKELLKAEREYQRTRSFWD